MRGMYFIAVHAGAGYHGREQKEAAYTAAMRRALKAAANCLDQGCDSLAAVRSAICALEDDPISNAGFGSNLTIEGTVECDASIMSGDGTAGAVGAVPGVQNPISVAYQLAVLSRHALPCGLVRPVFLAGDAARRWALSQGLTAAASPESAGQMLVSPAAAEAWHNYMRILQQAQETDSGVAGHEAAAETVCTAAVAQQTAASYLVRSGDQLTRAEGQQGPPAKKTRLQEMPDNAAVGHMVQQQQHVGGAAGAAAGGGHQIFADVCDTVGCLVIDGRGRVAAGVSSGGIALKTPGRVGEAAVIGAGVWASQGVAGREGAVGATEQTPGVCVSVSGVGERIMATAVAKTAGMQLQVDQQQQCEQLAQQVLNTCILTQPGPWDAGLIAARVTCSNPSNSSCSSSISTEQSSKDTGPTTGDDDTTEDNSPQLHGQQQQQQQDGDYRGHETAKEVCQAPASHADNLTQQQQQQQQCLTLRQIRVEFVAAFTSESFAVGYLCPTAGGSHQPWVQILRRSDSSQQESTRTFNTADKAPAQLQGDRQDTQHVGRLALTQPGAKCLALSCSWLAEAT